jgi:hypothetical protein
MQNEMNSVSIQCKKGRGCGTSKEVHWWIHAATQEAGIVSVQTTDLQHNPIADEII